MIPFFDASLFWPLLPGRRQHNECFDFLFYDTGQLTEQEQSELASLDSREGSLIVVSPGDSSDVIREYHDTASFLAAEAGKVRALVVAGVGSSVIGTAALARNVANVYDFDVAGIVSGYGASNLISEAFGGWNIYGASSAWRQHLGFTLDNFDALARGFPFMPRFDLHRGQKLGISLEQGEVQTLIDLLMAPGLKLDLVVGHSKGSMMLDCALELFVDRRDGRGHGYFDELAIVTFGAVSGFASEFTRVRQFLGEIDWFGSMHSRADVDRHTLPGIGHHLNTRLPCHLCAETVLREQVPI